MIRFYRLPFFFRCLYPGALYRLKRGEEREVFLTFDDGPHPDSTPVILDFLKKHGVKAMFFCNGYLCEEYPFLCKSILEGGHMIGNHGYHHIKGWSVKTAYYLANVARASELIDSRFYRPPCGSITPGQYRLIRRSYTIVMWDLLPYDFDKSFSPERVKNIILRKARPGSVIALHDKPSSQVIGVLDDIIEGLKAKEFTFALPDQAG